MYNAHAQYTKITTWHLHLVYLRMRKQYACKSMCACRQYAESAYQQSKMAAIS